MSDKPAALNRADLIRKVQILKEYDTFTVDDENYQILLNDCVAPYSRQWHAPSCQSIEDEMRKHGYDGVVNTLHALGYWASGHPLQSVVKRLPTQHEPTDCEIRNALKSTAKDMQYLHDTATDRGAKKLYHARVRQLEMSSVEEVTGFRRLCLMTAIAPFNDIYTAEPFAGKPLH